MEITLTISQRAVMDEVAQTAEYTGAKMGDEGGLAYERIGITDENEPELLRFWDESRSDVAHAFIRLMKSEEMQGDTYILTLNVSNAFDTALIDSMQLGLFSFFVHNIAAKWYVYTNKSEASGYADAGASILEDVKEKAFYKKKPVRPVYD